MTLTVPICADRFSPEAAAPAERAPSQANTSLDWLLDTPPSPRTPVAQVGAQLDCRRVRAAVSPPLWVLGRGEEQHKGREVPDGDSGAGVREPGGSGGLVMSPLGGGVGGRGVKAPHCCPPVCRCCGDSFRGRSQSPGPGVSAQHAAHGPVLHQEAAASHPREPEWVRRRSEPGALLLVTKTVFSVSDVKSSWRRAVEEDRAEKLGHTLEVAGLASDAPPRGAAPGGQQEAPLWDALSIKAGDGVEFSLEEETLPELPSCDSLDEEDGSFLDRRGTPGQDWPVGLAGTGEKVFSLDLDSLETPSPPKTQEYVLPNLITFSPIDDRKC